MISLELILGFAGVIGALASGFAWLKTRIEKGYEDSHAFAKIDNRLAEIKTRINCVETQTTSSNNHIKLELVELKGKLDTILVKLNGKGYYRSDRPQ